MMNQYEIMAEILRGGGYAQMSDGEVKGSFYRTEIIAQLFGVTVRRVQQLTQEGIISTTKIDDVVIRQKHTWKERPKIRPRADDSGIRQVPIGQGLRKAAPYR